MICIEGLSVLKSSAISLGKKSQKVNSIDNGRVGAIPNRGNALNYMSIAILVTGCILAALC